MNTNPVTHLWEVGTFSIYTYLMESVTVIEHPAVAPEVEALVREIIARVADKWTMLVLEALEECGQTRFTKLGNYVGGVSQKMLTKTLRQMERDGLITRTVYPVIPPRVEYSLTELGRSLGAAFCGVWLWAEQHHGAVERAREEFAQARAAVSEDES